jgi:hypothetical protein
MDALFMEKSDPRNIADTPAAIVVSMMEKAHFERRRERIMRDERVSRCSSPQAAPLFLRM